MKPALFLQSEVQNPYQIYHEMLLTQPVYRDHINNICAVYSYIACEAVFNNKTVIIPPLDYTGFSEYALSIAGRLARFRNPPQHDITKRIAIALFQRMHPVAVPEVLKKLLENNKNHLQLNWVDTVCKMLPVLVILNGFDFSDEDCELISGKMEKLVKIMLPVKTNIQLEGINEVSGDIYSIVEKHINHSSLLKGFIPELVDETKYPKKEILSLCISNLTGLLIQSYDACRGLLSNSLIQYLSFEKKRISNSSKKSFEKFIIETLRYDPPVHNTRRLATENIELENIPIKEGENILIVIAAANRDQRQFQNAAVFDIHRNNNRDCLSFGLGSHACVASHFAIHMAAETLFYISHEYSNIHLISQDIQYEAIINSRLATSLIISLNH